MMTFEVFLILLMIVSVFTTLFTQGIKVVLDDWKLRYHANVLAGFVAVILSIAVSTSYMILAEVAFNAKMAVILIALILLSWLSAMIGYDKVVQAIAQCRTGK